MSLFNRLVDEALRAQQPLAPLRAVVEKELLHHDILREMAAADLLSGLTFIGGTCLRVCHGSERLSEDLDFTGGSDFDRGQLARLGDVLTDSLAAKYGLEVTISEPLRESGNVDTWKLAVVTRPAQRHLPVQRIHIDICAIPSYRRQPMLLRNPYGVDMGTGGLIVQVETLEEILADKLVALALRPNRIKNRDLWDIVWLKQRNVSVALELLPLKIADHRQSMGTFLAALSRRCEELLQEPDLREAFRREMTRFLQPDSVARTVAREEWWSVLTQIVGLECRRATSYLEDIRAGA